MYGGQCVMKAFINEVFKGLGVLFIFFILFRILQQEGFLVFMLVCIIIIICLPKSFTD